MSESGTTEVPRDFKDLVGLTLESVEGCEAGSEEITFTTSGGAKYQLFHSQDCCEHVSVEDVCGDPKDLIGSPVLQAEESSQDATGKSVDGDYSWVESGTWTFYRIATAKGLVVIRWLGRSNGYYSELVSFAVVR